MSKAGVQVGPSGSKWGRLIVRRHLKERGVYSYNCNKLNKSNMLSQGSKLKKSSGCLLATNWRNIVTRCKFLVPSLYHVNDTAHSQGFWYFAWSQSREIHKTTQNTAKFGRNLIIVCTTYVIFETFLSYWGYLLAVNL